MDRRTEQGDASATRFEEPDRLRPKQAILGAVVGAVVTIVASLAVAVPAAVLGTVVSGEEGAEQAVLSMPAVAASVLVTGLGLSLSAWFTVILCRRPLRPALGLLGAPLIAFLMAPLGILGLGPLSDLLVQVVADLAPDFTLGGLDALHALMKAHSPLVLIPLFALVPGFAEELFFRGLVQRAFGHGVLAITISGLTFALFHMDPQHVAGVLPVGFYLAWMAARTGSTWVTIVAHVANNAMAVLASRIATLNVGHGSDEPMPLSFIVGGLLVTAAAIATVEAAMRKVEARDPALAPTE